METKNEFRSRVQMLMEEADQAINAGSEVLISQGKVVDLTDWVTIRDYCKRFGIKNTETVSNWIKRGIIPEEDTMVIEAFNHIRMVKAKIYRASNTPAV